LNINNHYIDAPADHPNDWKIITEELAFMKLEGCHTGENIGRAIMGTIEGYGLCDRVGWITSDGASVNRTAAHAIERLLDNTEWKAKEHDMM
jgi:hypothetical protein